MKKCQSDPSSLLLAITILLQICILSLFVKIKSAPEFNIFDAISAMATTIGAIIAVFAYTKWDSQAQLNSNIKARSNIILLTNELKDKLQLLKYLIDTPIKNSLQGLKSGRSMDLENVAKITEEAIDEITKIEYAIKIEVSAPLIANNLYKTIISHLTAASKIKEGLKKTKNTLNIASILPSTLKEELSKRSPFEEEENELKNSSLTITSAIDDCDKIKEYILESNKKSFDILSN